MHALPIETHAAEAAPRGLRRHDIDWLRVIAIGLLLVYHIVIIFQPWAIMIGFVQSEASLEALWVPMSLLNVWRIPLLFAVSGMGVSFAMRRRDIKELFVERARRILLPLVFGAFAIVPLHMFLFQSFYGQPLKYSAGLGHLWFLANILAYVLLSAPLLYAMRRNSGNRFITTLSSLARHPVGLAVFALPFALEAVIVKPGSFVMYAFTAHGFWLGFVAFLLGFCFVEMGDNLWRAVRRARYVALALALGLFLIRWMAFDLTAPNWLMGIESMTWLLAVFGLGYAYLNRPSAALRYLSRASYPVYIIHMVFLYGAASMVLPLSLAPAIQLVLIILLSFVGCYLTYELLIRRIALLHPLFGLKGVGR